MSHLVANMLPSPTWFRSQVMDTSLQGYLAYGTRFSIVLVDIRYTPVLRERFVAHDGKVTSVSFCKTKSDLLLASVSEDGTLKVWDLKNQPELLVRESGESKRASVVEWKHGSAVILFFSFGRNLKIFNMETYGCRVAKYTERGDITALVSCPTDPSILAIGNVSGTLVLFDVENQKSIRKLYGHEADIVNISFCFGSSKMLSSSSNDGTVRFWSVTDDDEVNSTILSCRTSKKNMSSKNNSSWTATLCHPTDPSFIVTTNNNFDVLLWNISEKLPTKVTLKTDMGGHEKIIFNMVQNNYEKNIIITSSLDRHIIFWDLDLKKSVFQISTLVGPIHSLAFSPTDSVKLALGCSDSCVRIWNTSSNGKDYMKILSVGIKGKVLAVSWHPEKEGVLAFSSDEGRVGIVDTVSNKYSFFATSHTNAAYSLCWGPCNPLSGADSEDLLQNSFYLYSCGGGKIYIHYLNNISKNAVQFDKLANKEALRDDEKEVRMEVSWKKDYSLLAVGNESGSIHIYNGKTFMLLSLINTPDKQVQCLVWHPEYVSLSSSKCSMHCWLACGSSNSNVCIYDLTEVAEQTKESIQIITDPTRLLKAHSDKAIVVAWSPHVEGRAVSASFDHTVQVWDVVSGQPVINFQGHTGRVFTVQWSNLDPDVIFSAGEDGLVLKWRISEQTAVLPKLRENRKRKKKKAAVAAANESEQAIEMENTTSDVSEPVDSKLKTEVPGQEISASVQHDNVAEVCEVAVAEEEDQEKEDFEESLDAPKVIDKSKMKKKVLQRTKPYNYMKKCSSSLYQKRQIMHAGSMKIADLCSQSENGHCQESDFPFDENLYIGLFADKATFYQTLEEEAEFAKDGNTVPPIFYDVWKGSIKEGILRAIETEKLTDLEVSLAPLVSHEFWLETCEKYAHQLKKRIPTRAAIFFLACNKIYEAIDALKTKSFHRDAVALARARLPDSDPAVLDAFEAWADRLRSDTQLELACNCYIATKQPLKAASVIQERHDALGYQLAAYVCKTFKYFDESKKYALDCIKHSLIRDSWDIAEECVALHPDLSGFLPVLTLHKSIVSQLRAENGSYGLQVDVFSDIAFEEKTVVWRCLRIEGQSYLQYFTTVFSTLLKDPNSESFKTVFAHLKEWVQDLQGHRLSLVVYSVTVSIALFLMAVLSTDNEEVMFDSFKYLNCAFHVSLTAVELNFFNIITQLLFPFDVIWNAEKKKIELLAVTETDSHSPFDLMTQCLANKISNSTTFQTHNVDFPYVHDYIFEYRNIEKIPSVNSVDVLLVFFTMNLVNRMKDQFSQHDVLLHCNYSDISKNCEEVMESVVSSIESNGASNSQDSEKHLTGGESSENNEIKTDNVATVGESKTKHISQHMNCFSESELFLQLIQVFSACVCKDAFAVRNYLRMKKEEAERTLLSVRIPRKSKISDVPDVKIDIEETSQEEVHECGNASVQNVNDIMANGHSNCDGEEITSVEAAGEPACDLEERYKFLVHLEKELDILTQERSIPDCIQLATAIKQLCDSIEKKMGCPYVKTIIGDFSGQLEIWLEKLTVFHE